jgi:SAM-dependent methyltransferase
MMEAQLNKWNKFYEDASFNGTCPPWESTEPFSGLVEFVNSDESLSGKCAVELGCGASASSIFLAERGLKCTAVDISPLAIVRARSMPKSEQVNWVVGDVLDPASFVGDLQAGTFDFVFDMQCFHILRDVNERAARDAIIMLLRPGGRAMVVTGAKSAVEPPLVPGPPVLTEDEVTTPFVKAGLVLESIHQTRFNLTPHYSSLAAPPLAWVAVFRKPAEA